MFSLFELNTEWKLVPATCDPCSACHEIIYGKQYQLHLNDKPLDQVLCEPCYEVMEGRGDED